MTDGFDLSGAAFGDVDGSGFAGEFINYLDHATDHFQPVKCFAQSRLQLKPGERVLDVGCGCGDDIRDMAMSIIPNGCAAGIDVSQSMIAESRRRNARFVAPCHFVVADPEALPWATAYFDACLADRVFQHLRSPARALNEMLRVTSRAVEWSSRIGIGDWCRLMQLMPQPHLRCWVELAQAFATAAWEGIFTRFSMKQECDGIYLLGHHLHHVCKAGAD
jgi:ubiquinone/menaquinone biosynthesis C-methylase UbiE